MIEKSLIAWSHLFEGAEKEDANTLKTGKAMIAIYNKIKLIYDNKDTGKREIYITKDSNNINNWGVLQYFEKLNSNENAQAKADALLQLYNRKTRKLQIKNAIGDIRVRGGSSVIVQLDLGDLKVQNFMIVEKVKHNFKNGEHFMDLTLIGGDGFVS